jgi:murein tripeptide amidase MpaA
VSEKSFLFFRKRLDGSRPLATIVDVMNNTEPEESELFTSTPEAEPVDDTEAFTDSDEERTEEVYDWEENDGQPDWAQEWHDFDPDC